MLSSCKVCGFVTLILFLNAPTSGSATELIRITEKNYSQVVPKGKEVDAIIGDWILKNDDIIAVIANPTPGRNANMTVRGVGGMLIDLTRRSSNSDQLSCFYPTAGRYLFEDPESLVWVRPNQSSVKLSTLEQKNASEITVSLTGKPLADDGTEAVLMYTLRDDQDWLEYKVTLRNNSAEPRKFPVEDSLRCDGNLFTTGSLAGGRVFFAEDRYFGQCYGFTLEQGHIERAGTGRNILLRATDPGDESTAVGESMSWSGKVACSQGLPGITSWLAAQDDASLDTYSMMLKLRSSNAAVPHALVEIFRTDDTSEEKLLGTMQADAEGIIHTELLSGSYVAKIKALGHGPENHVFEIADAVRADTITLPPAARVRASITDGEKRSIPAKVQFLGIEGTPDPDFGPDSAIDAIKNVVYCALGKIEQPIDPGKYKVIVSRGPEYDADMQEIEVSPGKIFQLNSTLRRSVDTTGWISSDFHSHSSPSGDNVSHQTGRVLNLLAEHIEFAPCTEHNRIDTYEDDLLLLGATGAMATCTGMELTGSPLPINHQNAFPLVRHEHTQDGGGPQTLADPVKQIERLALWDNSASKVVQTNHPNIPQILGDRDLDGTPDDGFRGMLGWMDVIEIHPPEGIFAFPDASLAPRDKGRNPTFFWLQLLNLGYRISGVVNTDAHYNFHGSGWLRNFMKCSTDNPAEIEVEEMIHAAEHGHMVMSTGPFLEFTIRDEGGKSYISGDDLAQPASHLTMQIRVQCPNWFDVNRVQVFANGRPVESLNFTRNTHPEFFHDSTVRFEFEAELPHFDQDTYLIAATIGEGLKLGPVMGPQQGELPPVAVTNPIFIDTDGSGFQGNGDDLGVPFMLPEIEDQKP